MEQNKTFVECVDPSRVNVAGGRNFFSSLLSAPKVGLLDKIGTYRKYLATVAFEATIHGNRDVQNVPILYQVGRHYEKAKEAFDVISDEILAVDCSFNSSGSLKEEFIMFSRRYTNFSGDWRTMDLAGVVERLAMGVASYSLDGQLTCAQLRGGLPSRVIALGISTAPVNASQSCVFIPRVVDQTMENDVFAALCAAVNGCGAEVVSDVVGVDPVTSGAIVPEVNGGLLVKACVEALVLLGANYNAHGAGDIYAYALTRGIHRMVSVVSHTDEGGLMRDVLRKSGFRVPYGGVHSSLDVYNGIPALASDSPVSVAGWVDSIALGTAALVAEADPCFVFEGELFPTIYGSGYGGVGPSGCHTNAVVEDARRLASSIASNSSIFCDNYTRLLAQAFKTGGDSGMAAKHMGVCFWGLDERHRHLQHKSVAPFFWIEPTSLVPYGFGGTTASRAGYGSLGNIGSGSSVPLFERVRSDEDDDFGVHSAMIKMRSARTCGLVLHLWAHKKNGLSNIVIRQADALGFVHSGAGRDGLSRNIMARMDDNENLGEYMWGRGHSMIPAPSMNMNINPVMRVVMVSKVWNDTDGDVDLVHFYDKSELDQRVSIQVSRPCGTFSIGHRSEPPRVTRVRSKAVRACEKARLRLFGRHEAFTPNVPVSYSAPVGFDGGTVNIGERRAIVNEECGGLMAETELTVSEGGATGLSIDGVTRRLPISLTHQTHRGPTLRHTIDVSSTSGVQARDEEVEEELVGREATPTGGEGPESGSSNPS